MAGWKVELTVGPARSYFPEIDVLKGVAIVCVVVIHSSPAALQTDLPGGHARGLCAVAMLTQFAVPCFLMCSGFLYATVDRVSVFTLRERLRRLLLPYLPAAILAGWFRSEVLGIPVSWIRDLLLGHTFGIYYYVFVIFTLVLVTPIIPRLPRPLRWLVAALLIASGSVRSLGPVLTVPEATARTFNLGLDPSFPWFLRHPLLVWGYFFAGWELRLVAPRLLSLLSARPWLRGLGVLPWIGLSFAMVYWCLRGDAVRAVLASWPLIYASLAALVAVTFGRTRAEPAGSVVSGQRPDRTPLYLWLSRRTYFIYLYHLFFVLTVQRVWPLPGGRPSYFAMGVHVLAGLAGPAALALLLERTLPDRMLAFVGLQGPVQGRERASP